MAWSENRTEDDPPYQIIESKEFEEQFKFAPAQWRDEIISAFHSELPANPDKFELVPGTSLRTAMVNCSPPMLLFFTVEGRIITLVEIHQLAE
jgi:hypothetical protein